MKLLKILNVIAVIAVLTGAARAQYANFRLHPSANIQIEPSIARHPLNPQILFASAFTLSGTLRSEGTYTSTDGGLTWFGSDTCQGASVTTGHGGDPGPVIDKNGVFILTHQGGVFTGMYSNYSTNNGLTWSNNNTIATNDQDKGSPSTDDVPSSPYYGRTYLVWTRFVSPFPIVISYTTNSGQSWVPFIQVNSSRPSHQSVAPVVGSGPSGILYTAWSSIITSSPFNEDATGFGRSTDGGNTWSVQEAAYTSSGIKTSSFAPWGIRVNGYPSMDIDKTGGARNGWIYIVTAEKNLAPAGTDADIVFHRSSDNGVTWSPGVRVNRDPINNGRVQFFPYITVDNNGNLNVLYFDNRNSADSVEVFLSHSEDAGTTWRDFKISDHKFKPATVGGAGSGNQGDNIGMTCVNNKLIPVWMDNSTGVYQAWYSMVDLSTLGVEPVSSEVPSSFSLRQNYPNPFNPSTKIEFDIVKASEVSLTVYDAAGREVTKLADKMRLSAGSYSIEFNGAEHHSGVYFYKLEAEGYSITKKMALVK
jgi:hypothetical protein